jgi:glucose-6-phosphate-specific signal transduction histidine kinase
MSSLLEQVPSQVLIDGVVLRQQYAEPGWGLLTLEVHDNGKGFLSDKLSSTQSLGILGMQERAILQGGELNITSVLGEGTTVRAQIPIASHPEREVKIATYADSA